MTQQYVVPHVNISGYAGAGKTTVSSLLFSRHKSLWVPRVTCRPIRPGERIDAEYLFVTYNEFAEKRARGEFLEQSIHPTLVEGEKIYRTGILHPDYWPKPRPNTELMISVFGKYAPNLKNLIKGRFVNILLSVRDEEELRNRLMSRGGEEKCYHHLKVNRWYKEESLEANFDYIVYNDRTPEETVMQIEEIIGLPPPSAAL